MDATTSVQRAHPGAVAAAPCALFVSLALSAAPAGAEPLVLRNQSPLLAPYGLPSPLQARLPAHASSRVTATMNWANAALEYREHWFWIDDDDLHSKRVLSAIVSFFTLADAIESGALPLITMNSPFLRPASPDAGGAEGPRVPGARDQAAAERTRRASPCSRTAST